MRTHFRNQVPATLSEHPGITGGRRIMKRLLLILTVILCIMVVPPVLAMDNPYRNAHKVTPYDVAVDVGSDAVKLSETSGIEFSGAEYTHTIGRVSVKMKPLLKGLDEKKDMKGNRRSYGKANQINYEVYRDMIKEQVVLESPETVSYSYDLALSDWVTIEPDFSRPETSRDANNTEIVSYPYTREVTSYARDSSIDIDRDGWGNLIISVNGEDVEVLPKPFATDASGREFDMDYILDKDGKTITITGDLTGAAYPVTVDPTERVTNGGFESGDWKNGWVSYKGDTSGYQVVKGDGVYQPYEGTYYLDVVGGGGYSVLRQTSGVNYDGATTVSVASATPVPSAFDVPVSNVWYTYGNWIVNNPMQTVRGWSVKSATTTLTGTSTLDIWTYGETHGHIDSIRITPDRVFPPVANFRATPTTGYNPLAVKFTDISDCSPTSWSWDFGDSSFSTERNPKHTYTTAGTYTVRLTVTNSAGSNTMVKTNLIVVEAPTFSMTDELGWSAADKNHENMVTILKTENQWKEKFYLRGNSVTKTQFGAGSQSGDQTLNTATLHFHAGHGYSERDGTGSYLELLDSDNKPTIKLTPAEVEGKWGGNNKWVLLSSCLVLRNDSWGKALGTSHGILGFKTVALEHPEFTQVFFRHALDDEKTVYDSFKWTTYELMKNDWVEINPWDKSGPKEMTIAAVVFKSQEQADNDYLPGIKTGIYPNPPNKLYETDWPCNKPPQEG